MSDQIEARRLSTADLAGTGQANNGDTAPVPTAQAAMPAASSAMPSDSNGSRPVALLAGRETDDMRSRWSSIQIGFVDDPRHAVEMADSLVAEVMQRLAQVFANQRGQLEGQWGKGQDVSTEELRQALQHYRSFFDRLLSF
jgi:hypothetical protein